MKLAYDWYSGTNYIVRESREQKLGRIKFYGVAALVIFFVTAIALF